MTEDELMAGITEALGFGGWTWMHIRRSDGVTMGHEGFPDIIAAHPRRNLVLAWELKSENGQATPAQLRWLLALGGMTGMDVRVIRPRDYDTALHVILTDARPSQVEWSGVRLVDQ